MVPAGIAVTRTQLQVATTPPQCSAGWRMSNSIQEWTEREVSAWASEECESRRRWGSANSDIIIQKSKWEKFPWSWSVSTWDCSNRANRGAISIHCIGPESQRKGIRTVSLTSEKRIWGSRRILGLRTVRWGMFQRELQECEQCLEFSASGRCYHCKNVNNAKNSMQVLLMR